MVDRWRLIRKAKELYSWYSFATGIITLSATGFGLAVGGAVWLVTAGIPLPLAIMAGFCTLVAAIYLAMAPMAYRALRQMPTINPARNDSPNYAAVRLQHEYTLAAASQLWVDRDPNASATYDSQAWYKTFVSAIQRGKLKFKPKKADPSDHPSSYERRIAYEQQYPDRKTTVTREEFKRYAASINQAPAFLRDN
jgi:hypothetical protein